MMQVLSLDARRELIEHILEDLGDHGEPIAVVVGGRGHTVASLRTFARGACDVDLTDILRQLNALEDDRLRRERRDRAERDELGARGGPDPQADFYAEQDAAATAAAAYRNSPAGRTEALIRSNDALAAASAKR